MFALCCRLWWQRIRVAGLAANGVPGTARVLEYLRLGIASSKVVCPGDWQAAGLLIETAHATSFSRLLLLVLVLVLVLVLPLWRWWWWWSSSLLLFRPSLRGRLLLSAAATRTHDFKCH
jgi:hypothetical protein